MLANEDYSIAARELDQLLNVTPQGLGYLIKNLGIDTVIKKNKRHLKPSGVRTLFQRRGYNYSSEIIAFSVVKGGVGKTSISHSFAVRAAQYGAKVLLVDLDQQANLTQAFGIDYDDIDSLYEVVKGEAKISDTILNITSNLHLLPSTMNMSFLDRFLQVNQENIATVFKDLIEPVRSEYDYIVFDCPPAISSVTAAATLTSDRIVMPVTPMKFSLQGLKTSFDEIESLCRKFKKKDLDISIIFNRFHGKKTSSAEYLTSLARSDHYNDHMMKCFIRESSDLENFINKKMSIFESSKKSPAREDIDIFTRELMNIRETSFVQ